MRLQRRLLLALFWTSLLCGTVCARPAWVVEPGVPGPDAPPQGRSLFDHLTIQHDRQIVPFPFAALRKQIRDRLKDEDAYLGGPLKQVLIPLGRSLQRNAAAPGFFNSPRVVLTVDAEPAANAGESGMLLRDRLFIAYLEEADILEIISYNEAAARFEFQVVRDYRAGGRPHVSYARRIVCTSCHQNAAPIFARPLWDETNSNARIAGQLQLMDRDFYGVPTKTGVDVAYAIDNSTDRANEFSLTQKLWEQGCGAGEEGTACRAALLVRVMQYALSGRRGFDNLSEDYRRSLRRTMLQQRQLNWPQGLLIPDPDIPNRRPLAGIDGSVAHNGRSGESALREYAHIAAQFEPLAMRPPKAEWNPGPDAWVRRAVSGLVQFLSEEDIRRIDEKLSTIPVSESEQSAKCRSTRSFKASAVRIKLSCPGDGLVVQGLVYVASADQRLSGRLSKVQVRGEDLGSFAVTGREDEQGDLHITLTRGGRPAHIRLESGDALQPLILHGGEGDNERPTLRVPVRHDFVPLIDAVHRLQLRADGSLAKGSFRRAEVLDTLFSELGLPKLSWCCAQSIESPQLEVSTSDASADSPLLRPFNRACASCHRSGHPFPPNFLAGPPEQALSTIAHCAERIQYRLAMWDVAPVHRQKTPMPPLHTSEIADEELTDWTTGLLPELRRALHEIAALAEEPLPPQAATTARPYFELRRCLPAI